MKQVINIGELKEYCENHRPHRIILYTENQPWYSVANPCKVRMEFSDINIAVSPNLVCLKSQNGTIQFDRVELAEIDTERTVLGTLLTLFCGDKTPNGYDYIYTLIMQ